MSGRFIRKERRDADKKEAKPAVYWLSGEQGKERSDPGGEDAGMEEELICVTVRNALPEPGRAMH